LPAWRAASTANPAAERTPLTAPLSERLASRARSAALLACREAAAFVPCSRERFLISFRRLVAAAFWAAARRSAFVWVAIVVSFYFSFLVLLYYPPRGAGNVRVFVLPERMALDRQRVAL
jgi:hypothetical protein